MEPVTIGLLVVICLMQVFSFITNITKTIKKSSCMGSNVEFRSSDSIRNLEGTLGQPALPK